MLDKVFFCRTERMLLEFPGGPPNPSSPKSKLKVPKILPARIGIDIDILRGDENVSVRDNNMWLLKVLLQAHEGLSGIETQRAKKILSEFNAEYPVIACRPKSLR